MNVAVVGASGYVGAELIALLCAHDKIFIHSLLVSENSQSQGLTFSQLHPKYLSVCDLPLNPFSAQWFKQNSAQLDAVFFATPHEFSAQWAQAFVNEGILVFDLSGGFRLKQSTDYPDFYGFEHPQPEALAQAVYGLAEWQYEDIGAAQIIAVPGCYPTASLLALKPITTHDYHCNEGLVVVNGISGTSGAGRKANLSTSFCEVSLKPYNILQHRHQPEISQEANTQVIFNPHIAPYKRGLLVTITLTINPQVTAEQIDQAFIDAYQHQPLIRLVNTWPEIAHVANTPFADIHWQVDSGKHIVVVSCAIDNLLKGAAAQAVQCMNISLGLPSEYAVLPQINNKAVI
jgi:N-acetyl-gamma-glutamyl-phosphate reductase